MDEDIIDGFMELEGYEICFYFFFIYIFYCMILYFIIK